MNYWGPSGQVDLAQRSRSPGSALKPFIYGLAFDDLFLHPATMMTDAPTMFGDYAPRDFDGGFQGAVTARDALRMSLNIPAVMVLDRVGPLAFTHDAAERRRAAGLSRRRRGAEPAGGAGRPGHQRWPTSPCSMPASPMAARRGLALRRRHAGRAGSSPVRAGGGVLSASQILRGVALPDGWAMGQGLTRQRTIAFKTGTSYGFRDAWSVGFSNDYTVGVWVGRADGTPRPGHVGRESAAPILLKTFDLLPGDVHSDAPPPAGAILTNANDQLPPSCASSAARPRRRRRRRPWCRRRPSPFRPTARWCRCPSRRAKDKTIVLKADGGRAPLTWLVNGAAAGQLRPLPAGALHAGRRRPRAHHRGGRGGPQRHVAGALQEAEETGVEAVFLFDLASTTPSCRPGRDSARCGPRVRRGLRRRGSTSTQTPADTSFTCIASRSPTGKPICTSRVTTPLLL